MKISFLIPAINHCLYVQCSLKQSLVRKIIVTAFCLALFANAFAQEAKTYSYRNTEKTKTRQNEMHGCTDTTFVDAEIGLPTGILSSEENVDIYDDKEPFTSNQTGPIVLNKEKNKEKLLAMPPQLFKAGKDTAWGITFFLILSPMSGNVNGSFDANLKSDSLASVEIILENDAVVRTKNAPHGVGSSANPPLLFMAVLNRQQKDLLVEHNIKTINFQLGEENYKYAIKDKYSDKLKDVLR